MAGIQDLPNYGKILGELAVDMTPWVGDAKALLHDAPEELREGKYLQAGLSGLSAIPVIGMGVDALRTMIKLEKARRAAGKSMDLARAQRLASDVATRREMARTAARVENRPGPTAQYAMYRTSPKPQSLDIVRSEVSMASNAADVRRVLEDAMRTEGVSLSDIARSLGVSRQHVHQMLRGSSNLSPSRLAQIGEALGFSRFEIETLTKAL